MILPALLAALIVLACPRSAAAEGGEPVSPTPSPAAESLQLTITGPDRVSPSSSVTYDIRYSATSSARIAVLWTSRSLVYQGALVIAGSGVVTRAPSSQGDVTVVFAAPVGAGRFQVTLLTKGDADSQWEVTAEDADLGRPAARIRTMVSAAPIQVPLAPAVGTGSAPEPSNSVPICAVLAVLPILVGVRLWFDRPLKSDACEH